MFDLVPQPVKNMIDTIFNAPLEWLKLMMQMLNNTSLVAGKGINLNNYFGWFGYLPVEWQVCVKSLIASAVLIMTLILVKAAWNMYLAVKNSATGW